MSKTQHTPTRYFPVLREYDRQLAKIPCPVSVKWDWIESCDKQAQHNHGGQTLQRLSERGGLSACELRAVIEGREYDYGCSYQADAKWLTEWIEKMEARDYSALQSQNEKMRKALLDVQRELMSETDPTTTHPDWRHAKNIVAKALGGAE